MMKPVEICLAVLGNRKLGNRHMAFGRLAWRLTREGATQLKRLENDPVWDELLVVGFDEDGNPLELPPEDEDEILEMLRDAETKPMRSAEAEASVTVALSSRLKCEPMTPTNRRQKRRINILRLMYTDRSRAWSNPA